MKKLHLLFIVLTISISFSAECFFWNTPAPEEDSGPIKLLYSDPITTESEKAGEIFFIQSNPNILPAELVISVSKEELLQLADLVKESSSGSRNSKIRKLEAYKDLAALFDESKSNFIEIACNEFGIKYTIALRSYVEKLSQTKSYHQNNSPFATFWWTSHYEIPVKSVSIYADSMPCLEIVELIKTAISPDPKTFFWRNPKKCLLFIGLAIMGLLFNGEIRAALES